jgi:hypothetical protein
MDKHEALRIALFRGWSPDVWAFNVELGTPEIEHPFDYLTEDEVESVVGDDSLFDIVVTEHLY